MGNSIAKRECHESRERNGVERPDGVLHFPKIVLDSLGLSSGVTGQIELEFVSNS